MISNIAKPIYKFVTSYNPVVFVTDSTNKNKEGFRYIYDIYSAGTSTLLYNLEIAPRINDGYGILFADKLLSNYLSFDFSSSTIPNSYIEFDVKVGETYGSDWNYDDYEFYINTGSTYNAYTQLRQFASATTHSYVVGDQINVVQSDGGALKPMLNGLHTVVAIPSAYAIIIDIPFSDVGSGVAVSGVTTYADNRKIIYSNLYNYSAYTAFNGAVPYVTQSFNLPSYEMSGTSATKLFVTNCPDGFKNTPTQDMFFNLINNNTNQAYYLRTQNSNGDVFRQTIVNTNEPMIQVGVGANNITGTVVSGTLPIVKDDTTYYDFWITNSANTAVSETFRVNIDRRCAITYDDNNYTSIAFLDRLGAFGSFAFQLKMKDTTKVTREAYLKQSGEVIGGTWMYNTSDNGMNTYNVSLERELELNTNWMTEDEGKYFDELVSSAVTFIKFEGVYQRCDVTETSYETTYSRNKNLIRKTIKVGFSNNSNINI